MSSDRRYLAGLDGNVAAREGPVIGIGTNNEFALIHFSGTDEPVAYDSGS